MPNPMPPTFLSTSLPSASAKRHGYSGEGGNRMFWWARPSRLFSMTAWKNTASNRPAPGRIQGTIPLLLEFECGAPGKRTHVHVHHHSPGIHRQPFFVHGSRSPENVFQPSAVRRVGSRWPMTSTKPLKALNPTCRELFDRLIIAQSLAESIPVITHDGIFASYGVGVEW